MDANRFDRFTRLLADAPSRRSVLSMAVGGGIGSLFGLADTEAKKRKKGKKGKGKGKGKGKDKNKKPCTVSSNAVSLVTETKFNKKPLRLSRRADLEAGGSQTEVKLGSSSVLRITHEVAEPGVVTTVTYGGAFRGIDQARFTTDGVTITGEIDGRAIVPLPVSADPSQMAFADGGPPLDTQGDAKLVQAIQGLFAKAAQQADTCQPARQKRSASAKDHSSSFDCIVANAECLADAAQCEKAVIEAIAACSIVPIFGTIACAIGGTGYCAYKGNVCMRRARFGPKCCPVRCGGDVEDLFGSDPLCCEHSQSCLDPNSNQSGGCCAAGMAGCGGECCPVGSCTSGFCCAPPNGSICGNQCCGPFDDCCGGQCCTGTCIGNTCCQLPNYDCGGFCCQGGNACCNGRCCAPGQICRSGQCADPHPCPRRCSDGECCPEGSFCCGSPGHCQPSSCVN